MILSERRGKVDLCCVFLRFIIRVDTAIFQRERHALQIVVNIEGLIVSQIRTKPIRNGQILIFFTKLMLIVDTGVYPMISTVSMVHIVIRINSPCISRQEC